MNFEIIPLGRLETTTDPKPTLDRIWCSCAAKACCGQGWAILDEAYQ